MWINITVATRLQTTHMDFISVLCIVGHAVVQLVEALRYKSEGRGFDTPWGHRPHYGPGVDSASNRNEYQEYFLGVKAAGA